MTALPPEPTPEDIIDFIDAVRRNDARDTIAILDKFGKNIIDATDLQNDTALTWAAYDGHYDMVVLLADRGADLEGVERAGRTALLCAIQKNKTDIVEFLLDRGARLDARGEDGRDARMTAEVNNYREVIDIIDDYANGRRQKKIAHIQTDFNACRLTRLRIARPIGGVVGRKRPSP